MSSKSRKRKAERRKFLARNRRMVEKYLATRYPGEDSRAHLMRILRDIKDAPQKYIAPPTFKFISVGYNQ